MSFLTSLPTFTRAAGLPARYVRGFTPRQQPLMARQSYHHELRAAMTVPFALAMLEAGVIGSVAKFSFGIHEFGVALLVAAPMFANVTSFMWASLAVGRRKVRLITGIMSVFLLMIASVAVLPQNPVGATMLVVVGVAARCGVAGFLAVRAVVWRANFPRSARASITGRFLTLGTLILGTAPVVAGWVLDREPTAYRWLFPVAAAIGVIGVFSFARIRLRREDALLAAERTPDPVQGRRTGPAAMWSVLRHDAAFRRYMTCQFLAGVANMAGVTAIAVFALQRLEHHPNRFLISTVLMTSLPLLIASVSVGPWSRLLDRMHIARFRVRHGVMWVVNQALNMGAAATGSLTLLALTYTAFGLVRGGGIPAWQLGHNDFASDTDNALYMTIHQTLTGVRGLVAPLLGTFLMTGWPAVGPLPGFVGLGWGVFAVTTVLALLAWVGFIQLSRTLAREGRNHAADA